MTINSLNFDAQELREKILDLAMRGKLVKQDPNDEPASVLLDKINREKERLIKEKKVKKTKSLPEITDDEKSFDIPDSWEWVRFGQLFTVSSGNQLRKKDLEDSGEYPVYGANGKIGLYSKFNITESSLLIGRVGSVGCINISPKFSWVTDNVLIVKQFSNLNKNFLFYLLMFSNIQKYASRTSQPVISGEKIYRIVVPLPPLEEQSRVADKVAQLFALLRKVESSNKQYVELQQLLKNKVLDLAMQGKLVEQRDDEEPARVLLEKIRAEKAELIKEKKIKNTKPLPEITDEEKPFDIPDSWEWVRLGDVYNFIDYRGKTPHKISNGIRLITAKNVRMGYIKRDPEEFISNAEFDERSTRGIVKKNDILITTEAPMGLVSLNTFDEPIATAQRLITLQKVSKDLNNGFISYYLQSKGFQNDLKKRSTGSTVKGIKAANLKQIPILVPPLNEQKRIVAKVEKLLNILG